VTGGFRSDARGGVEVGWAVSYPVGTSLRARLPVVLVLHGASGDSRTAFEEQALDRFRTLAVADGVPPFVLAAVDGGDTGWRPEPDGTDASRMLLEEFVPRLADRRLDVDRVALHGWSLGGYGALRLAGLDLLPLRAVTASSPALDSVPDDAPESDDVLGHPERLDGVPLHIDCGRGDPFYPVVHDFVAALADLDPPPVSSFGAGGHTGPYWRTVAPAQLRFAGERLA
jgi:enterochelin esterase-like enzyme